MSCVSQPKSVLVAHEFKYCPVPAEAPPALGRCQFGRRGSNSLSALGVSRAARPRAPRRSAWVRSGATRADAPG